VVGTHTRYKKIGWSLHFQKYTQTMRISGLKQFRKNRAGGSYFEDLPWPVQREAQRWLWKFRQRWGRNLPVWRFAILVGQAKRLALNPPSSEWGRSMLAKRGGYAVQKMYQLDGRLPTAAATKIRQAITHARKLPRVAYLRLD
jgi:hypothetical protein